jgi:hypothetical protein
LSARDHKGIPGLAGRFFTGLATENEYFSIFYPLPINSPCNLLLDLNVYSTGIYEDQGIVNKKGNH